MIALVQIPQIRLDRTLLFGGENHKPLLFQKHGIESYKGIQRKYLAFILEVGLAFS